MYPVSVSLLSSAYWFSFNDEPIATGSSVLFPRLSDPSFLLPEETPDGLWHLFAHTWEGVEHFTSTSGLEWKRDKLLFLRGHAPSVFIENGVYYLLFEMHSASYGRHGIRSDQSRVMVSSSTDLSLWSEPRMILDSHMVPASSFRDGREMVSRPQAFRKDGRIMLYLGAGETRIGRIGQKTSVRLSLMEASSIEGPYTPAGVIMDADPDSKWRSLATGSVRILQCVDGFAAFECAYYYDEKKKKERSILLSLCSSDGIRWSEPKVIAEIPDQGWSSGFITSCDFRYKENEDTWYCYYSADCGELLCGVPLVRESLGLLLGRTG